MRVSPINSYYSQPYVDFKKISGSTNLYSATTFKSNPIEKFSISKGKEFFYNSKNWIKATMILILMSLTSLYSDSKKCINDSFGCVPSEQTDFDTKDEAIEYAIDKIKGPLNVSEPYEYAVIIDYKTNKILSEHKGDSSSVVAYNLDFLIKDRLKIKHPHIVLHGHPESTFMLDRVSTTSFSFKDFKSFNNNKDEKESYVINKEGKYCILRKKENYKQIPKEELAELEKEFKICNHDSWANIVEVIKDNKVIHSFYDQQGMHAFWKKLGDKYNFEYYTTYGVYDGVDAYIDYYYPELNPPQASSGHRNFKK